MARRALLLVAKLLQALANEAYASLESKEPFMARFIPFLEEHAYKVREFFGDLAETATPRPALQDTDIPDAVREESLQYLAKKIRAKRDTVQHKLDTADMLQLDELLRRLEKKAQA